MRSDRCIASLLLVPALLVASATPGPKATSADETEPAPALSQPRIVEPIRGARLHRARHVGNVPHGDGPTVVPSAVPGQDLPDGLTLEDLERMALESNPTLVQARMAVRAAEGRYVQAGLYPNPVLGYAGGDIGLEGTAGQQGGTVAQEFVTAGKLRLGRAVASHEIQEARHGLEMQWWRVLNDVRADYYEVLLAQKTIDINKELVRIGNEGLAATEKLREAKEISRADVLRARIEAERARLGLVQARNDHQTAWRRLAAVIGRPELQPAPLSGSPTVNLPELTFKGALDQIMGRSPELAQARSGVQRARCELARQCAERVPNVEAALWVKHDATTREGLADVELSMPLPVFNRNQGGILEAKAGLVAAQREVRRVELALRNSLAGAFGTYVNARTQVETYEGTILPNARESLKLVGDGYRLGEFGYLDLLTAQRTYFSVSLEHLAALKELWARGIEIEGMLLGGALEPVK